MPIAQTTVRRLSWLALTFFTGPILVACASRARPAAAPSESQSYADAIRQICDTDQLAGVSAETGELESARKRQEYIAEHVSNSDAIYFSTIWRTKAPDEQAVMLAQEAQGAGLTSCRLVEALRVE